MTELLYMELDELNYSDSVIEKITKDESNKTILILVKTVFYPQGGGQPYDIGYISNNNFKFKVEEVRFIDGEVHHIGFVETGILNVNEKVDLFVDKERRNLNSKLHSSGHLIDIALRNLGKKTIIPVKGFHFPEGPYVEYEGDITESLTTDTIQQELNRLIEIGFEVKSEKVDILEAKQRCYFFPNYIPEGKPIRIVSVWNNEFIPCGGIHVNNIRELSGLVIKDIKFKKGNTRVSYNFDNI